MLMGISLATLADDNKPALTWKAGIWVALVRPLFAPFRSAEHRVRPKPFSFLPARPVPLIIMS